MTQKESALACLLAFSGSASFDPSDTYGELDVIIYNPLYLVGFAEIGVIATITFGIGHPTLPSPLLR